MAINDVVTDNRSEAEKAYGRLLGSEAGYTLGVAANTMDIPVDKREQFYKESIKTMTNGLATALGRNPSEQELLDFMKSNLDLPTARDLMSGRFTINDASAVASNYAKTKNLAPNTVAQEDPNAAANAQRAAFETAAREQSAQEQGYLDQLISEQERGATETLKGQLGEQLRRQTVEGAQMGRLSQPVQQENTNRATGAFMGDLAKTVGQIRASGLGTKAQAQESLLGRLQNQSQFSQNLNQSNSQLNSQLELQKQLGLGGQNLQNKSLLEQFRQFDIGQQQNQADRDLAEKLGKMKAEASKPGILDYINTGVNVASGLTGLAGGIKGLIK